jgi:hypothetical protein
MSAKKHKHYELDDTKIQKAKAILGAKTETETIELALEKVIVELEHNRKTWKATERLLKSGIEIKDVFGRLE